ncbi:hypothetical protein NKG94_35280 [Micromonospora sp. M12]
MAAGVTGVPLCRLPHGIGWWHGTSKEHWPSLAVTGWCRAAYVGSASAGSAGGDRSPPYRALRKGGIPVAGGGKRRWPTRWAGWAIDLEEVRNVVERQLM